MDIIYDAREPRRLTTWFPGLTFASMAISTPDFLHSDSPVILIEPTKKKIFNMVYLTLVQLSIDPWEQAYLLASAVNRREIGSTTQS
jgi:hypothetical protein